MMRERAQLFATKDKSYNKVTANQDKASRQIASLRHEIQALQQELLDYKTVRYQFKFIFF